ncbi:MAG: Asp-tRNA(Asn)/Glu-tRNA(Gln) amidotransferase subunit GatC [Candidatus Eisenbacteria bacterium]|nr:Asp-tRNA(Asn)/Glu-tRNA(Gln) amidotransferase subunit GatC [Candidatus Eisenbacteria bacterium]
MSVTRSDVEHAARLCRLEFSPDELETLRGELGRILEYVEKLRELDVTEVEPTLYGLAGSTPLREDVPGEDTLAREDALAGAPDEENGHFKVPGVL